MRPVMSTRFWIDQAQQALLNNNTRLAEVHMRHALEPHTLPA